MLLLETQAQMPSPQGNMCNLPIESHPELFALIRRATTARDHSDRGRRVMAAMRSFRKPESILTTMPTRTA